LTPQEKNESPDKMIGLFSLIKLWTLTKELAYPELINFHDHLNANQMFENQKFRGWVGLFLSNELTRLGKNGYKAVCSRIEKN
jgi:hypothetical protein